MDDHNLRIVSIASVGVAAITAVPALFAIGAQIRNRTPKDNFYEDRDGVSTPENIANFSNKPAKVANVVLSATSFATYLASAVIAANHHAAKGNHLFQLWLTAAAWAIVFVQVLCFAAHRNSVETHSLGAWASAAAFVNTITTWLQIYDLSDAKSFRHDVAFTLLIIAGVAGGCLTIAAISIPRRPRVQYNGERVDNEFGSTLLSRYTWSWGWELIQLGSKKGDLDQKDIPRPAAYARAARLVESWNSLTYEGTLLWRILRAYSFEMAFQYGLALLKVTLSLAPFALMETLLHILESQSYEERTLRTLAPLVIGMGIVSLMQQWLEGLLNWYTITGLSIPISAQLSTLVYEKSLRRKNVKTAEKAEANIDEEHDEDEDPAATLNSKQAIVNLIGVDARRIADFLSWQFQIIQSVMKLVMYSIYIVKLIGWVPFLAGLISWAVVLPFNYWASGKYVKTQDKIMKIRDTKVSVINEALQGIRQIKFAALERQWQDRILARREKELSTIKLAFAYDSIVIACWIFSPVLLSVVALTVFALTNDLTPSIAFTAIGIFKSLEVALSVIPELLTFGLDTLVSVRRIGAYLGMSEMEQVLSVGPDVAIENASIAWPVDGEVLEEDRFVLRNVDLSFPQGELSVISGRTGTGKSLLLSALLGEADLISGSIYMPATASPLDRHDAKAHAGNWILPGSVAYVSQTPWLESATLRENILFGLPYDETRYNNVISVCALKKDLEILEDGDSTELGANGINLSGGQKWRVTLARAIYSRAEILVMDDIFSAVDAHVGRQIFEKCIAGPICEGRTRILVTHHVGLVQSHTKYVVELGEGGVLNAGLTSDLAENGTLELIKSHEAQSNPTFATEESTAVNSEIASDGDDEETVPLQKVKSKDAKKFIEAETHAKGSVKRHVYATYINSSGGILLWSILFGFFIFCEGGDLAKAWWLRVWSDATQKAAGELSIASSNTESSWNVFSLSNGVRYAPKHQFASTTKSKDDDLYYYIWVYGALSFGTAILQCLRILFVFLTGLRAAKVLFERILHVVLRTPLRWLDTVPVGRILNRMTSDFDTIDSRLAWTLSWTMGQAIGLTGICIAATVVTPVIFPPAVVLVLVGAYVAKKYMDAARPMKRLESSCKSPIFELFNATLGGITTLRAYQKSDTYKGRMHYSIDTWSTNKVHYWILNRWMGVRMALVGSTFTIIAGFLLVTSPSVSAGAAGFALAFVVDFSTSLLFGIRAYAQLELDMNATERVIEYCDLKTENQGGKEPSAAWPTSGAMEVKDLVVGYADGLPAVLKGVSFNVKNNERIGVIGRTGAGKSSLTLALFRFLEPRSGKIFIDGLDISEMDLHSLRSRLAIIPQDPVLFSGSVRSNLDPFDEHTDDQLRDCLNRVHLLDSVPGTPANETSPGNSSATPKNANIFHDLMSGISEGGGNLSQGQRQLLCIARAIVARPKIMVLDEATSAVDMSTDTLIQRSIREEFTDTTMIVIAHRLSTIADFDRILVLSEGQVAEFGTPKELWNTEGSIFRDMCESSGERKELEKTVLSGK